MRDNVIVRLIVYYVAVLVLMAGISRAFPDVAFYVAQERTHVVRSMESVEPAPVSSAAAPAMRDMFTPERTIPVVVALVTAFLVTLPVTWVYRWTRPRKRYNQSFAHTLLVVPIAIALVVFLVKGSLALAFSLAGIVAALRFRTSLDEPMDAVYMFVVIGTGLAAGVQLLAVAFIASVVFNAVALGVWRTDFGANPAILSGWTIVPPDASGQLLGVSGVMQPVPGQGEDEKSPYNSKLRVQTTHVEAAQRAAIPVLDARAKNWQVAQVIEQEDGTAVVEFDVRLKKSTDLAEFIREIEESETAHISKVELKQQKTKKG